MAGSFTSELAERLLRRGTKPVGVIDVRPAQERYERATAWPRQHLTMLDRAAARQQTDSQPGQDQRLLLAARPLEAIGSLRDMIPADAVMDALRSSPNAPAFSPASLARIAARQQSGSSESAPATPAAATPASREDGPSRATARGETIVGPAMRAVTRSSADLPLPSRGAARADRDGRRDQSSIPAAGDGAAATKAATPTPSAPVAAAEPATTTTTRAIAVRASEAEPATIDTPHVFVQRRLALRDSGFGIRDSAGVSRDSGFGIRDSRVTASDVPNAPNPTNPPNPKSQIPNPVSFPAVASAVVAPSPAVDREPALSLRRGARSIPLPRPSDGAATSAASHPVSAPRAATERTNAESAPLQLVWRRGSQHDTSAATAASSATSAHSGLGSGAAAITPATGSTASTVGAADPAAAMTASGAGMHDGRGKPDLDQILEEVVRRLAEMQIVERERRGDPWL